MALRHLLLNSNLIRHLKQRLHTGFGTLVADAYGCHKGNTAGSAGTHAILCEWCPGEYLLSATDSFPPVRHCGDSSFSTLHIWRRLLQGVQFVECYVQNNQFLPGVPELC